MTVKEGTNPIITSSAAAEHDGLNPCDKRPRYLQRDEGKQNADRKAQAKKKSESTGLTLLEILCSDVENGVLLTTTRSHSNSGLEAGEKCLKDGVSRIRSQSNQEKRLKAVGQPDVRGRSTFSSSATVHDFENSLKSPSVNTSTDLSSSLTDTSKLERSAQDLNLTSVHSKNDFWLGEITTSSQSTENNIKEDTAYNSEPSGNSSASKNERSQDTDGSRSCRFVHFNDGRKLKKQKSKKENLGAKQAKGKLNRTRSLDVKLFQVDVPQDSKGRKSQVRKIAYDEIKVAPQILFKLIATLSRNGEDRPAHHIFRTLFFFHSSGIAAWTTHTGRLAPRVFNLKSFFLSMLLLCCYNFCVITVNHHEATCLRTLCLCSLTLMVEDY